MMNKKTKKGLLVGSLLASTAASAEYKLNLTKGVSDYSAQVYDMHMLVLWICVVICLGVFGAMFYSIIAHRKSKGVEPAKFSHSTTIEIIWTAIPVLILIAIALPATKGMIQMDSPKDDKGEPVTMDMTVKITGYQWKWRYDYLEDGFGFLSTLAADSNIARQKGSGVDVSTVDNYLLEVDKPLVIPANTNIRFLLTSDDVIHSWWVPDFGWKRDAIPGYINEAWTNVKEPGTYRGQCAELCGKDHGYMPIVVEVLSKSDYANWLAEQTGDTVTNQPASVDTPQATDAVVNMIEQSSASETAEAMVQSAAQELVADDDAEQAETEEVDGENAADEAQQADGEWSMERLMARGEEVYNTQCLACHKIDGSGMPPAFPALANSAVVTGDIAKQIDTVVNGVPGTGMMPFGNMLPAEDIAATITYTRNSFGNDAGDRVQPADVEAAKQ
ncbi:cytochrome c oxidase subunit II [Marinicella gelatinilytica]|uniref:cytochrome c oxidase subunit II n=1 Tax=Marinicella gelatinilytica TaxID=2996017 RepID=UPI002260BF86|nr:cytochrome c oxidase subunit II [Marinicella gelatinilytica]MCX7544949.1 cytochrome c oxidase subunit II [Marinicella gelatinilytica]